jgi:hypothetical protein
MVVLAVLRLVVRGGHALVNDADDLPATRLGVVTTDR